MTKLTKLRWKLWRWASKLPRICPAVAHSVIIEGKRRDPRIDWMCTDDLSRTGTCWCGKLRSDVSAPSPSGDGSAL